MNEKKQIFERFEIVCPESVQGIRSDKYVASLFPDLKRSQIQKALEAGGLRVNGVAIKKKHTFAEGDGIELLIPEERSMVPTPVAIPLEVIYEDNDIIVVNKAAGMVTHPGSGTGDDTLCHALLHHCQGTLSNANGEDRPGIVHRLDKDTSGVIVVGKTDEALTGLIEQFKTRGPDKIYMAICAGIPPVQSGTLEGAIGRDPRNRVKMAVVEDGRPSKTDWKLLGLRENVSLIQCKIYTGRTHQIRVHMSDMGFPIIGDAMYGYPRGQHRSVNISICRPLLHAWKLSLSHPISGKVMDFEAKPPEDFLSWMDFVEAK